MMNKKYFLLALMLALGVQMSYAQYMIKAYVEDPRGVKVPGVKVSVNGSKFYTTDATGYITYPSKKPLTRPKEGQVVIKKNGFKLRGYGISFRKELEIMLEDADIHVTGRVSSRVDNSPFPHKPIEFYGVKLPKTPKTDANGKFKMTLPAKTNVKSPKFLLNGFTVAKTDVTYDPNKYYYDIKIGDFKEFEEKQDPVVEPDPVVEDKPDDKPKDPVVKKDPPVDPVKKKESIDEIKNYIQDDFVYLNNKLKDNRLELKERDDKIKKKMDEIIEKLDKEKESIDEGKKEYIEDELKILDSLVQLADEECGELHTKTVDFMRQLRKDILGQDDQEIAKKEANLTPATAEGDCGCTPWWVWWALGAGFLFLWILIIIILMLMRKVKKQKEQIKALEEELGKRSAS